ncbi:hypothetical protein [Laspinema palackyanum]|nr:hypothetical protein [Laspinema sp. D2c]
MGNQDAGKKAIAPFPLDRGKKQWYYGRSGKNCADRCTDPKQGTSEDS